MLRRSGCSEPQAHFILQHLNEYDSETDAEDVVDDQPVKKKKRVISSFSTDGRGTGINEAM